jgi:hypothetical protein
VRLIAERAEPARPTSCGGAASETPVHWRPA